MTLIVYPDDCYKFAIGEKVYSVSIFGTIVHGTYIRDEHESMGVMRTGERGSLTTNLTAIHLDRGIYDTEY